jgi:ribonucleoside-triphosphate reductase
MAEEKKAIKVKFPEFDNNTENLYQEEMDKIVDMNLSEATTTRTLKNITENLAKALKSKYGITDKEELKYKVNELLKLHGMAPENLDPISFISKQVFGNLQSVNDVSIDDNANKTDTNMTGVCVESFLPYQKLAGYDYLYQTIKDLYGTAEAKKCTADMYDFSLFLNDSTKILIPYCYCIDASKIVTEGRNFGQVHSSPAHRISTYISVLGDTIREMSFNVAGALAIGTFFMDIAHLAIYRERIALEDLKTDKKVRKSMSNHFQQFIHTVNHYSRNAVESPFTNVSLFDRNKLEGLIAEDNYGWYFPKKAAACEDNGIEDTKEAWKDFVLDYIEVLQEIYIDVFDEGDPLRDGLQFPFPVTTVNFGTTKDENGKNKLTYEDNALLNYLTKNADISRYNIYASEGSKVASCCRLLSDSDFLAYAGGVNSFGGSQVSLGSHRVVTINFARCAYEAESYDDFKKIVAERVARMGKILKAHKVLILKLEELGKQPWISNGWIDMTHMFSTFGCVGYVEADQILKFKFNHVDFDYMKDFLVFFNDECGKVANQENIIFNIEAIPAEGAAPKIAKADKLIFADENGDYLYE